MMKKYTLIEILVVIAIIGILAAITLGVQGHVSNKNKEMRTKSLVKQLELALEECKEKFGYYPVQAAGAFATTTIPSNTAADSSKKAYGEMFRKACDFEKIEKISIKDGNFVDGWEEPLFYESDGKNFNLFSCGMDKVAGSTDKKAGTADTDDFDDEEHDDIGTF